MGQGTLSKASAKLSYKVGSAMFQPPRQKFDGAGSLMGKGCHACVRC